MFAISVSNFMPLFVVVIVIVDVAVVVVDVVVCLPPCPLLEVVPNWPHFG